MSTGRTLRQTGGRVLLIAALLGVMLFGGVGVSLAAPPAQGDEPGAALSERLELLYRREQNASDALGFRLERAHNLIDKMPDTLARLAEKGYDVSDLEAALATFETGVAEAEGYHQQAVDILARHAGFDDSGTLTDREAAVDTLRSAGRALRDAQFTLADATVTLRRVILDWREANTLNS